MSKGVPSERTKSKNDMSSYIVSANREREMESKRRAAQEMKQKMQPALEEFLGGRVLDYEQPKNKNLTKIDIDAVKSSIRNNRNFNFRSGSEKSIDNPTSTPPGYALPPHIFSPQPGRYEALPPHTFPPPHIFSPQPRRYRLYETMKLPTFNNENNSLIQAPNGRPFYARRKAGQIYN